MTIHVAELIDALAEICREKDLKCTLRSSAKGGILTGLAAGLGGLLLGRSGILLGAAAGGLIAAGTSDSFKSVPQILREMTNEQKRKLADKVLLAFRDFGIHDFIVLLPLLSSQESVKQIAIDVVKTFLRNEMHLSIT